MGAANGRIQEPDRTTISSLSHDSDISLSMTSAEFSATPPKSLKSVSFQVGEFGLAVGRGSRGSSPALDPRKRGSFLHPASPPPPPLPFPAETLKHYHHQHHGQGSIERGSSVPRRRRRRDDARSSGDRSATTPHYHHHPHREAANNGSYYLVLPNGAPATPKTGLTAGFTLLPDAYSMLSWSSEFELHRLHSKTFGGFHKSPFRRRITHTRLDSEDSVRAEGESAEESDSYCDPRPTDEVPMAHMPVCRAVPAPCPPRDPGCCCCCCTDVEVSSRQHGTAPGSRLDATTPFVANHGSSGGRSSPGHDLGYHTLVSRQTPTPTRTLDPSQTRLPPSPAPWSAGPPFLNAFDVSQLSSCPRGSPRPQPPQVPSDTEQLLTTYKGKKLPKSSPFDRLTDDLILKIFSYLSTNQLCICARVCRRWYFLAWEPQLWTTIDLTGELIHADRALRTLVRLLCRDSPSVCLTVEKVTLNGCTRLSDRGLAIISRRCPELRHLEVRGCHNITNAGILELVSHCVNLEHLDLTGCYQINCIDLTQTVDAVCPSEPLHNRQLYLQYLDLTDCHALEDAGLKVIVRNCPQLLHFYLRRCVQLTDMGVKYVASYCMVLRELSISDCIQITDFGMYELAKLGPNLRYLSVAKCDQISDAGIKQIARHCYKLRYLNVRGCEAVSDDSMEVLARSCPRLRALDIGKCDVTDHGLKLLSEHCPNLKKLSVKSCDMITDKGVQCIAYYCRGLQQLNIQDCQVTIECYRTVKKFCKRCIIEHTNPGFY